MVHANHCCRQQQQHQPRRISTNGWIAKEVDYTSNNFLPAPSEVGDAFQTFNQLGRTLQQNMEDYTNLLRQERLAPPSLLPSLSQTSTPSREILQKRSDIVEMARQIVALTLEPSMSLLNDSLQFHFCSALKVAVDLRVGEHIPRDRAISLAKLAKATGAEETLLIRIMRLLTARYVFAELQPGFYSHTSISWSMQASAYMNDLLCHRLHEGFRSSAYEADALRQGGYREPRPGDITGFNLAFQEPGTFWDYTWSSDSRSQAFSRAMKAVPVNSVREVAGLYPFPELARHDGLIVDVGGGMGQLGRAILERYPGTGLRCIVQDRSTTAAHTTNGHPSSPEELSFQQHDFFDPQPIKGAAAYIFRHILHDWPDESCIEILRQTISAMEKNHSRILIVDQVMQQPTPALSSVLYDADMMTLFGGKERTLNEFIDLVNRTDERLRILSIKQSLDSMNTIIELGI